MRSLPLLLLCAALLPLTACSGPSGPLQGTAWDLVGWSQNDADLERFGITAEFEDGRIAGRSAVNSYFGEAKVRGNGDLLVGVLGSTMMAGPDDAMEAEGTYLRLLQQMSRWQLDGAALHLSDEDGKLHVRYRSAKPAAADE